MKVSIKAAIVNSTNTIATLIMASLTRYIELFNSFATVVLVIVYADSEKSFIRNNCLSTLYDEVLKNVARSF